MNANPNLKPGPQPASLRRIDDLVDAGLVAREDSLALEEVVERYALALSPEMAALIDPKNPLDSIALQFIPSLKELEHSIEERADPIGDEAHSPVKGLVHRYRDRVLLKPLHICPVYCRFCFRREVVGPEGAGNLSEGELAAAFAYIAAHEEIFEVIVTGGDPFMLSPRRMAIIAEAAGKIAHVKVLRWHSRVPLVDPGRVTNELVAAAKSFSGAVYVAVHANHPREFTPAGRAALARLSDAGIALLSQSVLLKGVNDNAGVLEELMRAFVANRIKPYYLHQGDLAPGTAHFRTTIAEGQELMRKLRGRLSGIAQPTYVLDLPGGYGKVPIGPDYFGDGGISDPAGEIHSYPEASKNV